MDVNDIPNISIDKSLNCMFNDDFRFYLAGCMEARLILYYMRDYLVTKFKSTCTSEWMDIGPCSLVDAAEHDYDCLEDSNILIATFPTNFGTTSEIAYAIAKKIPVIYLIDEPHLGDISSNSNETHFRVLPVGKLKKWRTFRDRPDKPAYPGYIAHNIEELNQCFEFYIDYFNFENKNRIN